MNTINNKLWQILAIVVFIAMISFIPIRTLTLNCDGFFSALRSEIRAKPPKTNNTFIRLAYSARCIEPVLLAHMADKNRYTSAASRFEYTFTRRVRGANKANVWGKDGWLFYMADDAPSIFKGVNRFSEKELKSYLNNLTAEKEHLASYGMKLVLLIVPNKETIYGEFMAPTIKRENTYSKIDQLVDYLRSNGFEDVVYPKAEMIAEHEKHHLYFKDDTHWTPLGAFIASQQLNAHLGYERQYLNEVSISNLQQERIGDISRLLATQWRVQESEIPSIDPKRNGTITDKKVFIAGDSFRHLISPEFAHIRREHSVDTYEPSQLMSGDYDIVVLEAVERYHMGLRGFTFRLP